MPAVAFGGPDLGAAFLFLALSGKLALGPIARRNREHILPRRLFSS